MKSKIPALLAGICIFSQIPSYACTGITLKSKDGATVAARTIEWAESVMYSSQLLKRCGIFFKEVWICMKMMERSENFSPFAYR